MLINDELCHLYDKGSEFGKGYGLKDRWPGQKDD